MKNLWLLILSICFSFTASQSFAAKTSKKKRVKNRPSVELSQSTYIEVRKEKPKSKIGINFFSFYSGADQLKTSSNSNYNSNIGSTDAKPTASFTGSYEASTAIGLGMEYAKPSLLSLGPVGFGVSLGGSYEFNRTIKRNLIRNFNTTITSSNTIDTAGDPSFDLILPYINATVIYGQTYMFAGINYSAPQFSNANDEEYTGEMGFQAGFGSKFNDWISVEASYRAVNFNASPDFSEFINSNRSFNIRNIDVETRRGLGIISDESLELTGFMLSVKFSI